MERGNINGHKSDGISLPLGGAPIVADSAVSHDEILARPSFGRQPRRFDGSGARTATTGLTSFAGRRFSSQASAAHKLRL